MKFELMKKIFL